MELLLGVKAFYLEQRRRGELESEMSEGEPAWIVTACSCGAQLARRMFDEKFLDR